MALLVFLLLAFFTGPAQFESSSTVRLVGGPHRCEGRVEVQQNGEWGTVCDDGWGMEDVAVVCRELNCGEAKWTPSGTLYTPSTDKDQKVFLQEVICQGHELNLSQCDQVEVFDCTHDEDAGAQCEKPSLTVRLAGGPHRCEGRVEVQQNGEWHTMCHAGWGMEEAAVVCRELNCGEAKGTPRGTAYEPSTGTDQKVLMQEVICQGHELNLTACEPVDIFDCFHNEGAGVQCEKPSLTVRLAGGPHRCEGRVEVQQNGEWHTMCHAGWGMEEAAVVCRELNCGEAKGTPRGTAYEPSTGTDQKVLMQEVICQGHELNLTACEPVDIFDCFHNEGAGVQCEMLENVRLVGGPRRCKGRVEVKHQGKWGTVCKAGWNLSAVKVVCRQLGCGKALLTKRCCSTTQGQGPIWLSEVSCSGRELSLQRCSSGILGKNNCTHDDDMCVECEDPFDLRLVGGDTNCSGRLEVLHKGEWGSVCDDGWGEEEDRTVCKQLGCGESLFPSAKIQKFGRGVGRIWLDDVRCSGKEKSLEQCQHRFWGHHDCNHKEDVAVICSEP
ncbi:CD5 antigen-like precursor [Sus scrofa]|uniref:CD5 molecule like n=2 Tax=Sus scrofa TaxID=9823 RepID=A0A8D0SYT8_PIG|nr:CD5 antigen-like precursor [Sus scrofa]